MKFPHLFEFMDQPWIPASLAATLREILSCGNARPFRPYYNWVADEVARLIRTEGYENVVELGAGTAPISRLLAQRSDIDGVRLIVCDSRPDAETYADLKNKYQGRIVPELAPVDFSQPRKWPPKTLVFLSGTFHHVPEAARAGVLNTLTNSADAVMIVEPLRKTLLSLGFVFLSVVPAVLLPLWYLNRPGRLRRFFWCWLVAVAPLMFCWDGIASCLRMWSDCDWKANSQRCLGEERRCEIKHTTFCQMVTR